MSALLDLTQPLRTNNGDEYDVMASNVVSDFNFNLPGDPPRSPGQTLLVRRKPDGDYRWYYPDGQFFTDRRDRWADLVNFKPSVVVKARRHVQFRAGKQHPIVTTPMDFDDNLIGTVEFTVTDGVLTNVEIVQ